MSAKTKDLRIRKMSAPDLVCKEMKALITQGTWEVNKKYPRKVNWQKPSVLTALPSAWRCRS